MSADACNVPWPVCPDCLGEPLVSSADLSQCPRCRRRWAKTERDPCPDTATVQVRDSSGGCGRMCRSHAVRARAMIVGSAVEGLDDAALAVAVTLEARDEETEAIRAADYARELAELEGRLSPLDADSRAEIDSFRRGEHPAFRAYGLSPDEAARMVKRARVTRDDDEEK